MERRAEYWFLPLQNYLKMSAVSIARSNSYLPVYLLFNTIDQTLQKSFSVYLHTICLRYFCSLFSCWAVLLILIKFFLRRNFDRSFEARDNYQGRNEYPSQGYSDRNKVVEPQTAPWAATNQWSNQPAHSQIPSNYSYQQPTNTAYGQQVRIKLNYNYYIYGLKNIIKVVISTSLKNFLWAFYSMGHRQPHPLIQMNEYLNVLKAVYLSNKFVF